MTWKLLGKKTVLKTFRSSVQSWKMRLPNGRVRDFFISAGYSFVVVFVLDTKGRVVILKQHYIGQHKKLVSLVAGIIDENEKAGKTARRELLEETGYAAKRFVYLGKSIKGKYSTGDIHHFLALDASKVQESELEDTEDIEVQAVTMREFKKLLDEGKMPDAFAEVCAYRALEYLDNKESSSLATRSLRSKFPRERKFI